MSGLLAGDQVLPLPSRPDICQCTGVVQDFFRAEYLPLCCVVVLVVSRAAKSNSTKSVLGINWLYLGQTSKRPGLIT